MTVAAYSVWLGLLAVGVVFALAWLPIFRSVGLSTRRSRFKALDGLRGYLALAVVLHHASIYHQFLTDGVWQLPPSKLYSFIGPAGVQFFFLITGYLFWQKVITERTNLDFPALLAGRFVRIAPVYVAVIAIACVLSIWASGVQSPWPIIFGRVLQNALFGILPYVGLNDTPIDSRMLAGVTWTLQFEWLFYIWVPALAFATRLPRGDIWLPAAGMLISTVWEALLPSITVEVAFLFSGGMLCAGLQLRNLTLKMPDWALSCSLLVLTGATALMYERVFSIGQMLPLVLAFFCLISGATIFKILELPASIRLGEMSFSIYLAQGPVLFLWFNGFGLQPFALSGPIGHWSLVILSLCSLTVLALVLHITVEQPGYFHGRRFIAKMSNCD